MQNCVFNGQVGAGDEYGIHVCYQMLFLMWGRNIYSRINSHGFCEMKSATKYWQVFSAISSDPVRSERKGARAFLSHGSSGLPHSFLQS